MNDNPFTMFIVIFRPSFTWYLEMMENKLRLFQKSQWAHDYNNVRNIIYSMEENSLRWNIKNSCIYLKRFSKYCWSQTMKIMMMIRTLTTLIWCQVSTPASWQLAAGRRLCRNYKMTPTTTPNDTTTPVSSHYKPKIYIGLKNIKVRPVCCQSNTVLF